jgi:hypothetical protein
MAGPWEKYQQAPAPAAAKPWEKYAQAAPAVAAEKPGFFQQEGGLADYLPQGVTDAMQGLDDITQSAGDAVTRGWGGDDRLTEEARARTTHTPTDIIAGVAASPYKVGSMLAGGAFGAGEGALRSYGEQEGWAPEWGQIGQDALIGGVAGGGGYALPGAWNAAKSGLQKTGAIPKLVTGGIDMLLGAPVTTVASGVSGVTSKAMPALPKTPAARDLFAKMLIGLGT